MPSEMIPRAVERRCLKMRLVCLYPVIVLFATLGSISAVKVEDLRALEYAQRASDILRFVAPANILKNISNPASGEFSPTSNTKCSKQVKLLQQGLTEGWMWALKMFDASSKIPSGILMGNSMDLGMFDECVEISITQSDENIHGRHCMYKVSAGLGSLQISETLSICLPASCEPEDVRRIVNSTLEEIGSLLGILGINIPISVGDTTCTAVNPPEWTTGGILTLCNAKSEFLHRLQTCKMRLATSNCGQDFGCLQTVGKGGFCILHDTGFALLLSFLVICTIGDIFARYSYEKPSPSSGLNILCQCSLYSNAVRVLSTQTSSQTLPAIQGLRFFSMCWVIIGHVYMLKFSQPTVNILELMMWAPTWEALFIMTATFAVESFFTISGFLMSYIFLKEMSTGRSFNLFSYYLHRYLRLTPAFLSLILITIFISPRIGSGPIWESNANLEEQACRNSWWSMLLYLHNYINTENRGCLGHTWYLAVEMQFFWISPLILYPLARKPKVGLGILAAFFVASVATPVKIGYDNEYSTTMISNRRSTTGNDGHLENFYIASHVRAAPWLIGIFFGYLHFTYNGITTSKISKWIGWLLATAAFSFCIFSMRVFESEHYKYDIVWESFYTGVARPLWGFAVSWVIYACVRGFGGAVSTFLSYPIYTPLSRISYCVYLVHYEIQFMKGRSLRTSGYFSAFNGFDQFLSDLLLSIIMGFIFTVVFESPVLVLEKIVKKRRTRSRAISENVLIDAEVETGVDNPCLTSS